MKEAIIELKDFSFQYKAQSEPTLKGISLTIYEGEKVLIVGPSGSGKSTIGQCLNGIIPNIYKGTSSGQFLIQGTEAFDHSIYEKSHLVSTVLQDTDGQFIGLSVAEDLAFALENDMVEPESMKSRVHTWAERLDLSKLLDHRPQDLSGGQKQRVSLAGVLIDESPILLFDEPLANLDPKSGQDIIDLIDQIHEEQGTTTIIIEHRLEDVLYRPIDRVILINQGQVLFNGEPDELLRTTLLAENGIREPLYLTTLRQLGQDISKLPNLDNVEKIPLEDLSVEIPTPNFEKGAEAEAILELGHLNFAYRESQPILKDLSLTVPKGQRLAIVGKNGAGKSTLAKAICGFIQTEGTYFSKGEDIKGDSVKERAERVGYVLQNPNQMISSTMVFDEVALGLRLRNVPEDQIESRVHQALKTCGLYEFRKWPISALSYGQKKRVTIASILVLGPEVLVLDEPTAGLDPAGVEALLQTLEEINARGTTLVFSTHEVDNALAFATHAAVMTEGKLRQGGLVELLSDAELLAAARLRQPILLQLSASLGWETPVTTIEQFKERWLTG